MPRLACRPTSSTPPCTACTPNCWMPNRRLSLIPHTCMLPLCRAHNPRIMHLHRWLGGEGCSHDPPGLLTPFILTPHIYMHTALTFTSDFPDPISHACTGG